MRGNDFMRDPGDVTKLEVDPRIDLASVRIGAFGEDDEQEVDHGPDDEAAEREQLQHRASGLAGMERCAPKRPNSSHSDAISMPFLGLAAGTAFIGMSVMVGAADGWTQPKP